MDAGGFDRWLGEIGQLDTRQRSRALWELILMEANEPPVDCAEPTGGSATASQEAWIMGAAGLGPYQQSSQ